MAEIPASLFPPTHPVPWSVFGLDRNVARKTVTHPLSADKAMSPAMVQQHRSPV